MGTDWLHLFNKRLCDEIVSLDSAEITHFVQTQLANLDKHSVFRRGFGDDVPAADRLLALRRAGKSEQHFKINLVLDLCVFGERLYLDYWACYAENLIINPPPGSVADTELFPQIDEHDRIFLLLGPGSLDRMLTTLQEHREEVAEMQVMQDGDIMRLRQWRDRCSADKSTMAAYFFDY